MRVEGGAGCERTRTNISLFQLLYSLHRSCLMPRNGTLGQFLMDKTFQIIQHQKLQV